MPVIETGVGNCHVYVHGDADLEMATLIVLNAKCQNPSVCNAAETVLVDRNVADRFLPVVCQCLRQKGVRSCLPRRHQSFHGSGLSMTIGTRIPKPHPGNQGRRHGGSH